MKRAFLFLFFILPCSSFAAEKTEGQIAKSIQCTYLRDKSFLEINNLYSVEKFNPEYIKKVSDSIYAQAFRICDPENIANADKEILAVCTEGCDQFVTKGLLGIGGPSASDVAKCKKICINYSDLLSLNYTSAIKALKRNSELNPPVVKAPEAVVEKPVAPESAPAPAVLPEPSTVKEEDKKK